MRVDCFDPLTGSILPFQGSIKDPSSNVTSAIFWLIFYDYFPAWYFVSYSS